MGMFDKRCPISISLLLPVRSCLNNFMEIGFPAMAPKSPCRKRHSPKKLLKQKKKKKNFESVIKNLPSDAKWKSSWDRSRKKSLTTPFKHLLASFVCNKSISRLCPGPARREAAGFAQSSRRAESTEEHGDWSWEEQDTKTHHKRHFIKRQCFCL